MADADRAAEVMQGRILTGQTQFPMNIPAMDTSRAIANASGTASS
jgi:hypothetical protein